MKKTKHITLKSVLDEKLKDLDFKLYFTESKVLSTLCLAISHARKSRHISQLELAKRVGTHQSVIARLENGNDGKIPSLDLLSRVATALNMRLVVGFEGAA